MLTHRPHFQTGASLIELAIGVVIVAIVMTVGIPSFQEWIANSQIRTAADSVMSGMNTARAEAVRRNTSVEFILTGNGGMGETGWRIRVVNTNEVLQEMAAGEGSKRALLISTPENASTVTFNGLGRLPATGLNDDGSLLMTRVVADVPVSVLPASQSRELRVSVTSGGQVRMCDPNVSDATDPRKCDV